MTDVVALWLPAILQILLGWHAKNTAKSWLYPSACFNLYWGLAFLVPAIGAPDYAIWPGAAWYVLATGIVLHAGVAFGAKPTRRQSERVRSGQGPTWVFHHSVLVFALMTALGVIAVLIIVVAGGYSPAEMVDAANLAKLAQTYSARRYAANESQPLSARVLTAFPYVGCLMAGVAFAFPGTRSRKLLACLPMATILAQAILLTTRTPFLYSLVLMAASHMGVSVLRRTDRHVLARESIIKAAQIAGGALVFGAFILSMQVLREGASISDFQSQATKTRAAAFGSPAVFSHWLRDTGGHVEAVSFGGGLFGGLYEWFGVGQSTHPRVQGLWAEVEILGPDHQESNVHTMFRSLIEDFTLPGSFIAMLLLGFLAGIAYRRTSEGATAWLTVLVCFYVFLFPSYLSSVFNYNSIVLSLAVFWILVRPRPIGMGIISRMRRPESERRLAWARGQPVSI